jgi:hypothetical protein
VSGDPNAAIIRLLFDADPTPDAAFGFSLAALPDLSGDGKPEIAIGSPTHLNSHRRQTGRVYVYEAASGKALRTWDCPSSEIHGAFGYAVAHAGDVNGDGVAEVVVGAPVHPAGP